ncbi:MAG: SAM-dependent methyltransferase [Hydrogenophaga sp.]|uniref:class I SAM-dependent methyltransferase n=1 Tax=Hydrogenophaga sp. TaxID=1904254 RepID=UPI002723C2AE|nr:SAM-dependent methyltransferase [Hydrogenophaga sp.]MDO9479816.1 SAM-dependent methyltransferase [Hydrogenophaga sp.]MDP3345645.1 SAM-dependent methyltransferase [Hydrogenophaga sp.]MDP3809022.1 SAM-dependent methyltransferase [Hydrogenophaga sp.]MDZ4128344.1 SAM-dependent methyltransferase [Hydrogenophaga sp.]
MPGYQVKTETVTLGGVGWRIRCLLDTQQYADPINISGELGIPPAGWSLFGQVWPSARVLALAMQTHALHGLRILEMGAGLALSSLVLHRRGADVTVSDWHPLTESFLKDNLRINGLGPVKYQAGNWETSNPRLGRFDLLVGSDLLYERQQPAQLAGFIHRHAAPGAQVIIVDPDRGNRAAFGRAMGDLGFTLEMRAADRLLEDGTAYKGRFLTFQRPG